MAKIQKREITVPVKGVDWKFEKLGNREYDRKHPGMKKSEALTDPQTQIVSIRDGHVTFDTVIHELLHVYVFQSNIESMNIDADNMEELCCSLVAEHYFTMGSLAQKILKELLK